jgi:Fe-coproporphyrin III synthase
MGEGPSFDDVDILARRVVWEHGYSPDGRYPAALVNVTNRCTLSCAHCFVFRDANAAEPQRPRDEIGTDEMLRLLQALRDRHGIQHMLWMGGEPLLRKDLVARGCELFPRNHVVTNGTVPLLDLGSDALYVISLDGPEDVNDPVRGAGVYRRVLRTLSRVPEGFATPIQVQCVVTRENQGRLGELVRELRETRVGWVTFSFYVARAQDTSGLAWATLEDRMVAVREVAQLKDEHPGFVRNRRRALELMAPEQAPAITANCLAKRLLLPLYLEGDRLRTPFCCYGNDVDCASCGSWFVFEMAALFEPRPGAA